MTARQEIYSNTEHYNTIQIGQNGKINMMLRGL